MNNDRRYRLLKNMSMVTIGLILIFNFLGLLFMSIIRRSLFLAEIVIILILIGLISCILLRKIKFKEVNKKIKKELTEKKKKLMVIVPHPDDELNIASVLIKKFIDNSDDVYIVFSTNFDAYGKKEALVRYREVDRLYKYLNIPNEHIIFLGYKSIKYFDKDAEKNYSKEEGRNRFIFDEWLDRYYLSDKPDIKLCDLLYELFLDIKPDVIVGIDSDANLDHRYLCCEFDRAAVKLVSINDYEPLVLKGFSYATSWMGKKDFYTDNLSHSQFNENGSSVLYPYFWNDRIQIPYEHSSDLGFCIRSCWSYKIYGFYKSQNALSHINQIINTDQVYWKLHTDNLFNGKGFDVSSGSVEGCLSNIAYLRNDISTDQYIFTTGWEPDRDDEQPHITFCNKKKRSFRYIEVICQFMDDEKNKDISFHINGDEPQSIQVVKEYDLTKFKISLSKPIESEKVRLSFNNIRGIRIVDIYIPMNADIICVKKIVRAHTREFLYSLLAKRNENIKLQIADDRGNLLSLKDYTFLLCSGKNITEIKNDGTLVSLECDFAKGELTCIHTKSNEIVDTVCIYTSLFYKSYIKFERVLEKLLDWYLIRLNSSIYEHKRARYN